MTEEQLRNIFEAIISGSPFELSVERWPDDYAKYAWPGGYIKREVALAWEFFKEGAKLR